MNKQIVFLIKVMNGGGAERVVSLLTRAMAERGCSVTLILTHQTVREAMLSDIDKRITVISLPDETDGRPALSRTAMLYARLVGKAGNEAKASVLKYRARNYSRVQWLRDYFKKHKNATAVAFLYDSIFLTLLSKTKNNKVVISERGDPCQSLASRTTMAFLKNEFKRADEIIFQSPDVKKWYEENAGVSGTVIFNPVKSDLPEPYQGAREKTIVTFCRISESKNLPMLINSFHILHRSFEEYRLKIIGGTYNEDDEKVFIQIKEQVKELCLQDFVDFKPFSTQVHSEILNGAMYVNSSDHEGMSNSMLEAMAIGLPCVCTDCPAGGARAVIRDGENGLLVPVKDANALAKAMKRIITEDGLAERLSRNAVKIREEQSLDKIIEKWMNVIND